jgi:NAD(P)-dependent dehydrogenase (short-subunit alcohol dehydrogenase family)
VTITSARAVAAPRRSASTTLWDAAHATLFLGSDEARYIAGVELVADGGLTL